MIRTATAVRLIRDGVIKFDGGTMFGSIPKMIWKSKVSTDRQNRMVLGLNCLLIQTCGKNVLIDTGTGSKELDNEKETYGLGSSRLLNELRRIGISPKHIDTVILTHLHFDHCGGATRIDRKGRAVPTFPRATYMVQRRCWENASLADDRCQDINRAQDYEPIEDQLELLDGDQNIMPGVSVKVTGGHTIGHQIALAECGGERIVFLGDLIPTPYHLDQGTVSAFDHSPEDTLEMKREILSRAEKEGWLLIFAHGNDQRAGYIETRRGTRFLRPIDSSRLQISA